MFKNRLKSVAAVSLLLLVLITAGCGGGSGLQRIAGLSPENVVKTFFNAARDGRFNEAGLYVSAASKSDAQTVMKFITGQSGLEQFKNSNLLSVKQVAQQGDYTVMVATLQDQNSFKITVKPVALEKVDGEWYIVDTNQIYQDAKYKILQQLLANI
ncbi:MAG: hypothetical protein ABFC84_06380 [Veillonellales bacterium]